MECQGLSMVSIEVNLSPTIGWASFDKRDDKDAFDDFGDASTIVIVWLWFVSLCSTIEDFEDMLLWIEETDETDLLVIILKKMYSFTVHQWCKNEKLILILRIHSLPILCITCYHIIIGCSGILFYAIENAVTIILKSERKQKWLKYNNQKSKELNWKYPILIYSLIIIRYKLPSLWYLPQDVCQSADLFPKCTSNVQLERDDL